MSEMAMAASMQQLFYSFRLKNYVKLTFDIFLHSFSFLIRSFAVFVVVVVVVAAFEYLKYKDISQIRKKTDWNILPFFKMVITIDNKKITKPMHNFFVSVTVRKILTFQNIILRMKTYKYCTYFNKK